MAHLLLCIKYIYTTRELRLCHFDLSALLFLKISIDFSGNHDAAL